MSDTPEGQYRDDAIADITSRAQLIVDAAPGRATSVTVGGETYPIEDWRYEVANGDTNRSYADWRAAQLEADGIPAPATYERLLVEKYGYLTIKRIEEGHWTARFDGPGDSYVVTTGYSRELAVYRLCNRLGEMLVEGGFRGVVHS